MRVQKGTQRNFAFGQRRNGNRGLYGNRTEQRAVGGENLYEVCTTVRDVNLSVGSAVAVLAESDQCVAGLGASIGSGKFADGKNLLALSVEHQQAGRRRGQNVQPSIPTPLHRAQPGTYARQYPLSAGNIASSLTIRPPTPPPPHPLSPK